MRREDEGVARGGKEVDFDMKEERPEYMIASALRFGVFKICCLFLSFSSPRYAYFLPLFCILKSYAALRFNRLASSTSPSSPSLMA
jgi:hypothetical protein